MTVLRVPGPAAERRRYLAASVLGFGAIVIAAGLASLMVGAGTFRIALVAAIAVFTVGLWAFRPALLLPCLVVWTVGLGLLRRLVTYSVVGVPTSVDPLLLIGPLVIIVLVAALAQADRPRVTTTLSRMMAGLVVLICIEAVNPLQGSVTAGPAALVFFVPILAFWIGRDFLPDVDLRRMLTVLALLALPVVVYGYVQLNSGLPSWDASWVTSQGYSALSVGGVIRPFSSLSSASEYAALLVVAIVVWAWLRPLRSPWFIRVPVLAALLVSLFFESSRGVVFLLVGTTGLVLAARSGVRFRTAVVIGIAAILLLPSVASRVLPQQSAGTTGGANTLVAHEASGLANPTGATSTFGIHATQVAQGLQSAITDPVGRGISVVTIAGKKFGGAQQGTETDVSNAAVALGLIGLALVVAIICVGFRSAYRLAVARRDPLAYAALGILAVTFLQWLNGGQYAIAYLPWLVLGWVDRRIQDGDLAESADEGAG